MTPTRIHLVRHGAVHNPQGVLYGRLPGFKLSAEGRRQAGAAAALLGRRPLQAVFASPMLRARQTATEILRHHPGQRLHISPLLNEVCSPYEGRPGSEVDALQGDVYSGAGACFEQPADIARRMQKFLLRMRNRYPGRQVAAVTHGDVILFTVLWTKGWDLAPGNKIRLRAAGFPATYPAPASITTLIYRSIAGEDHPQVQYRLPY